MTERFLRAPHWQLFACSFGLPFLAQLTGIVLTIHYLGTFTEPATQAEWPRYLSSAGSLTLAAVLYGWMWSVGAGLQTSMPREFRRSVIGFGAVLTLLAAVCVASLFFPGRILLFESETSTFTLLFWTLLPLLAVWMGAHLYGASYVADIIISAEEQRKPTSHELIQLTLLIWLFPVGIWSVQPRVNRLALRAQDDAEVFSNEINPVKGRKSSETRAAAARPILQD